MTIPLSELRTNARAAVEHFLDDQVASRLIALGIRPQQVVSTVRLSPFKDAMYVSYGGSQMALRMSEAAKVIVRPL